MINNMTVNRKQPVLVIVAALIALLPAVVSASGGGAALLPAKSDVGDVASLQRGARNFVNYCMGCHSAKYIRFSQLQEDLQLTDDQVLENLMFAAKKTDELMTIAMPAADAGGWFGQAPPDLTLVARSRGSDWVYNFLKSFYLDDSTMTGTNNTVLPNASMPHVLWELQGLQEAVFVETTEVNSDGEEITTSQFDHFETVSPGDLEPEDYDQFVRDIVNFLDWAGTPEQLQRQRLGIWVIIFLFIFLIFAYLLKVEIWKDVK